MTVTPLFIQMVGSNEQEWQAAIRQQQAYQCASLLKLNEVELTAEEAAVRMKARMKELYLKNRQERHEKKRALKLLKKSYEEQRHDVCQKLIKTMSLQEVTSLGLDGIKKLVNQKLSTLRKLVGILPLIKH